MSHACHRFGNATKPSRFAHFWQGPQSLAPATRNDIWTSKSGPSPWCFSHFNFEMCFARQHRALFDISTSKSGPIRTPGVFHILTSKCASCHNGVHFFDISTSKSGPDPWCFQHFDFECASRHNGVHFFNISISKSGPRMVCFVHFHFEMCFAPQWHALFRHLNFQKWSGAGVFCTFWLGNVLRATTACNFHMSSGQRAPHPPL